MAVGWKGKVMTDYIKREALEQRMYHEAFENDASYDERNPMAKWDSGLWIRYKLFENVLASIPSADVVEPKRGEWIGTRIGHYPGYECSLCHYGVQPWNTTNFCPNCGADMRK